MVIVAVGALGLRCMEGRVMSKKLIPFGEISESFTGLKDEGIYYVDKTGFIPFLIEQKRKICVATRPRRFGKTLMLKTLEAFFEYRLNDDGKPVDNRRYFEGLKVMDAGEEVLREMGQYPVIFMSLKDVSGDSIEEVIGQLCGAVRRACYAHEIVLKKSGVLGSSETDVLQSYLDGKASEANLMQYFEQITEWLYRATKRKTVILLDEYDVPLQKAAIYDSHHPGSELFDKTVKLIGKFISSGFKTNSNLAYGVISGCMRVAEESIFTGMNNPGVIDVMTDELPDEFWGFTENDVKQMLAYYNLENKFRDIEQWYDGYIFGGRKVFNPWSLLNAIRGLVNHSNMAIQSYWVMTSGNDIIDDMIERNPQHRECLARLMNGETLRVPIYKNISYRDLQGNPESIWSFLLYTGYLKAIGLYKNEDNIPEAEIAIPNTEIKTVMFTAMRHWWQDIYLAGYDAKALMGLFWNEDATGIMREINALLDDSISVRDAKEEFYHGMMVGVLRTQCKVMSNREYGNGYPDIVAIWGSHAVILELKCITPSELKGISREEERFRVPTMMVKLLDEAEGQIKSRHYIEGLLYDEPIVTEVKAYALCFCRKRCMARLVK